MNSRTLDLIINGQHRVNITVIKNGPYVHNVYVIEGNSKTYVQSTTGYGEKTVKAVVRAMFRNPNSEAANAAYCLLLNTSCDMLAEMMRWFGHDLNQPSARSTTVQRP